MLIPIIVLICAVALTLVAFLVRHIYRQDAGTEKMREIASAIKSGSEAYLKRQYKSITVIAAIFTVLFALAVKDPTNPWIGIQTASGFLLGALCSNLAGYIAMRVAVSANVRTASAVRRSFDKALKIAFRGGLVFGLAVVSMSLLGIAGLYLLFNEDPRLIVGFGFGASFAALFAQLGGGIYTKAADMSADLVGKVEAGIPEDDPRNPAVIADNVGDNVGDIAGRGADLFESITAENIGAMILGSAPAIFSLYGASGVVFPLVVGALGLIATMVGAPLVYARSEGEDPFKPLLRGLMVTSILCVIFFYLAVRILLNNSVNLFLASLVGIATAALITLITNYYTSYSKRPVLDIVNSAKGGAGPGVATGLAVGMESTGLFIAVISVAVLISFALGGGLPVLTGEASWEAVQKGIYGTAVATMGMLSVAPMILALDGFGPIVDNSSGILEMSGLSGEGKGVSEKMDAIGNTTKALTKGYAVGSAALSAFLLFFAFLEVVKLRGIDIGKPAVFIGGLLGAMLIFLFSALAIKAVGRTSAEMIDEIRRQFREIPGILEYKAKPDYARCVDISTKAALKNMVAPGLLVIALPIIVGLILGTEAVGALQMVGITTGILMALFMNNGGAAMDNAKKYVEAGNLGGKGSPTHSATVVGDTVGDPLKDTAGPSIHIVIKLLNTMALALAPLFLLYALM